MVEYAVTVVVAIAIITVCTIIVYCLIIMLGEYSDIYQKMRQLRMKLQGKSCVNCKHSRPDSSLSCYGHPELRCTYTYTKKQYDYSLGQYIEIPQKTGKYCKARIGHFSCKWERK